MTLIAILMILLTLFKLKTNKAFKSDSQRLAFSLRSSIAKRGSHLNAALCEIDTCYVTGYAQGMIRSFKHKGLAKFFKSGSTAGIQAAHAKRLRLILGRLNAASDAKDMDLPGLRLHELSGNRVGLWSVTVSGNWRVTFRFEDGDAEIVNYEDYH